MKILAICGSVRGNSSNGALLRAAAALAPRDMELVFYDEQLGGVPPFNPDLDGEGAIPPPPVGELRALLAAADGVIISSPEYAHGAPGVLKNALDWIVSSGELERKPVVLICASPGGGRFAQASLTPTLEVMGARMVLNAALTFTRKYIDSAGNVSDPEVARTLQAGIAALAAAAPDQTG
jgi:chromate reductase, NAD(P)H dehydrogenase (quinone)